MDVRRALKLIEKSGLKPLMERYTFDKYLTPEPWQVTIKESALSFLIDPAACSFVAVTRELSNANNALTGNIISSTSAHADRIQGVDNEIGVTRRLINEVFELSNAHNKSADDRQRLAIKIDQLNDSMEGLNLQYDSERGELDQTRESIDALVDARERELRAIAEVS
jgi:hypothetical protein